MRLKRIGTRDWTGAIALVAAGLSLAGSAVGQEVCVACVGPDATYKCIVKDAERLGSSRNAERAIGYVCITELARAGGHERCRVSTEFVGPCIGQERRLDLNRPPSESAVVPDPNAGVASREAAVPAPPAGTAAPAQQQSSAPPPPPPRTLEELARNSMEQSQQQLSDANAKMKEAAKSAGTEIEKAGSAIGEAMKKSVGCLVTLFTKC